MVVVKIVYRP
jgi:hypothetical protein